MIECLRDEKGRITAVCEWLLLNEKAELNDAGTIMYVCEMEINPEHRGTDIVRQFITMLHSKAPWVEKVFFYREYKYPGKLPRIYDVHKIVRKGI